MQSNAVDPPESVARALALVTAADACVSRGEIDRLDALDAFRRIGVSRARFMEIAHACRTEIGENLIGLSWLPSDDLARIDGILDAVRDPGLRLLVCRLAAAALEADSCAGEAQQRVFAYMLARWRVYRSMLTHAVPGEPSEDPAQRSPAAGRILDGPH